MADSTTWVGNRDDNHYDANSQDNDDRDQHTCPYIHHATTNTTTKNDPPTMTSSHSHSLAFSLFLFHCYFIFSLCLLYITCSLNYLLLTLLLLTYTCSLLFTSVRSTHTSSYLLTYVHIYLFFC